MISFSAMLVLGFVLGMRHATDADHVVAVTTIVSRARSIRAAAHVGAAWGVGHTLTVTLVGGAIILCGLVIPPRIGLGMELLVALMLIVLGVVNLSGAIERFHHLAHGESHRRSPPAPPTALGRSLGIGVVHGLAGSAAVALLVLTTIRDAATALAYLLLFGVGTIVGMMLLTSLIAAPFAVAGAHLGRAHRWMVQATSLVSIGLGVFLAYKIGIVDGLFLGTPHWTPE